MLLSSDAGEFKESDHPRRPDGKFGSKGGSSSASAAKPSVEPPQAEESGFENVPETRAGKIAPKTAQHEGINGISHFLGMVAGLQPKDKSPARFVLENGIPYTVNEKTFEGPRAPMRECYKNAALDAINHKDRTYVEGYVSVHGVPIEHAWTVDASGQVYDSTIHANDAVAGYFGVPFSQEYLFKALLKNKVYGLLGMESRKTLEPLLKGDAKDFKQEVDLDKISDEAVHDRLAYAEHARLAIADTSKIDTPERRELRKKITSDLYNKNIAERKHDRDATIVLGLPASGKSTLADPIVKAKGALEIDPDLAKAQLPEYQNGIGAFATHEESSAITRDVMAEGLANGDNIVWARVDSPEKTVQDIKNLKRLGYKVHVQMLDVEPEVAEQSAIDRYLTKGRYVSPLVVREYGTKPKESYLAAKNSGLADSAEMYRRGYSRGPHESVERVEEGP